jgi:ABC-type amino acid transport substrate-binding protein/nitrogen-specific signal transduction histidine kinase/DNA-binding response OmpR family regulator
MSPLQKALTLVSLLFFATMPLLGEDAVTLRLKWHHQFQFAGYYMAKEKGFYEKAGLHVNIEEANQKQNNLTFLKNTPAGYTVMDASGIAQRLKGEPIVTLGAIFQHSPNVLLSLKSSGIKEFRDLKGRRVMADFDDSNAPIFIAMQEVGLRKKDFTLQTFSYDYNDLLSGKTDAMSAYITDEPYMLTTKGIQFNILDPLSYGINFYGDMLYTSEEEVKHHPERAKKFLEASIEGWEYALKNVDETIDVIKNQYHSKLSKEQLRYEAMMVKQMILAERISIGHVSETRIKEIGNYYLRLGFVPSLERLKNFIFAQRITKSLENGFQALLSEEEKNYLLTHKAFKIGFIESYPPFSYVDDLEKRQGIIIDTIDAIKEYANIELIPKPMPWPEVMQSIQNRSIDLFFGQENEERKVFSSFTSPVSSFAYAAFSHDPAQRANTLNAFKNKKVITIAGFAINESLKTVSGIELIYKKNTLEALESLLRHEADFFVDNLLATNYHIKEYSLGGIHLAGLMQEKEQFSKLGVRNDDPLLYSILQKAVNYVPKERFDAIQNRWVLTEFTKSNDKKLSLSAQERQWIEQHPIIHVANDPAYQPFDFYENEQATGFSIELFERLTEMLGLSPVFVTKDWNVLLDEFKKGSIDVMTSVHPDTENTPFMSYSKPYIKSMQVIVTGKNSPDILKLSDLAGKRLAIPLGYEILSEFKRLGIPIIHVPAKNILDALQLVAIEKADFTIEVLPLIDYFTTKFGLTNLKFNTLSKEFNIKEFHFGIQKKEPILAQLIDKALNALPQEEIVKLQRKWFLSDTVSNTSSNHLSDAQKEWLLEHRVIKVANDTEWAPYDFTQNGKAAGYSVDLLGLIGKSLGVTFEFTSGVAWKELLEQFQQGHIDLLHATVKTPQREKYVHFSKPYIVAATGLVKASNTPVIKNLEDAIQKYQRIGVVKGHWTNEILKKEFPSLHVEEFNTTFDALNALSSEKIPLFIGPEQAIRYFANRYQIKNIELLPLSAFKNSDYENLRFGVQPNNTMLESILEKTLDTLPQSELIALQRKWFGDVFKTEITNTIELSEEERAFLKKHPVFRIGTDRFSPPYDFKDSYGILKGISKDFFDAIFHNIQNTTLEYSDDKNWKESVQKVADKQIDILLSYAPMKENNTLLLSMPYIEIPYMLFGTSKSEFVESIHELKGETIGFAEKSHDVDKLRKAYPGIEFVAYSSGIEFIEAINLGVINYFLSSLPAVNYVTKMQGITNIKLLGKTDEIFRLSFAVRSDWPEMVGILNKYLRAMSEAEKNKIYDDWYKLDIKPTVDYSLLWKAIAFFTLALFAFFYWNRKLSLEIIRRKQTEEKLIIAQMKAENANRAKSEFLSNMSHEIRTPMNAIIGFAELTSKMELPKVAEQNIQTILRSAKALIAIINDILDLSKIEAGKLKVQKEPIDIHELADELHDVFYVKIAEKGLDFTIKFSDTIPNALFIDEIRIRQILLNLVGNAIKFTEKGTISITFDAKANTDKDSTIDLHVSVTDTGIGINPEDREKVFELFEQQSGQDNRKFGGTGLGLSISQKLANLMGGEIILEAQSEGGSTFTLLLYHVEIASANPKTSKSSETARQFQKELVLAVDDIDDNLKLITTLLEGYGFDIISTNDGAKSIELALKHQPKLVFMDIKMPNMDGYEVTAVLKNTPETSHIPVIAVSASVIGEREEAMRRGLFDAFVSKPIDLKELEDAIALYIPYTQGKPELATTDIPNDYHLSLSPVEKKALMEHLETIMRQGNLNAISQSIAHMSEQKILEKPLLEKLQNALNAFDLQEMETLLSRIITQAKKELENV